MNLKRLIPFIIVLEVILVPVNGFTHSGRLDKYGGHKDNNNVSGLGYYHYHCGTNPEHLHTNGCPYKVITNSSNSNSNSNNSNNNSNNNNTKRIEIIATTILPTPTLTETPTEAPMPTVTPTENITSTPTNVEPTVTPVKTLEGKELALSLLCLFTTFGAITYIIYIVAKKLFKIKLW